MPLAKMSLKWIIYNIIVMGIIVYKTFRRGCPRCHHAPCQNILKRNSIKYNCDGPFQRHVCDQKSGKFHFRMATAPGANMLSTSFWLIIVRLVRVKTYRSLKIKFFVKVKNKVHVTIGHVCDFARNYGPAPNDFKVKIKKKYQNLYCIYIVIFLIFHYLHIWYSISLRVKTNLQFSC